MVGGGVGGTRTRAHERGGEAGLAPVNCGRNHGGGDADGDRERAGLLHEVQYEF